MEVNLANVLNAMTMEELIKHGIETYGFSKVEADLYATDIKGEEADDGECGATCPMPGLHIGQRTPDTSWHATQSLV
jgi:hypothetical protein